MDLKNSSQITKSELSLRGGSGKNNVEHREREREAEEVGEDRLSGHQSRAHCPATAS